MSELADQFMVERLDDQTIAGILSARERCNEAGLDLIRWAREVRAAPIPA